MIPSQPGSLFSMPFAQNGNRTITPETTSTPGRASLSAGFPTETQLPLNSGGVAPNRLDFNGMFHMLSAFAFWQQSGGMWTYKTSLNYAVPAVVYHNDALWWCVRANGPEVSGVGAVPPGTNESYWANFFTKLAGGSASTLFGNPVGSIIMYPAATSPTGYLPCDGSAFSATAYPQLRNLLGRVTTPDMRGLFVRGYDPGAVNDPDAAGRGIGSAQGDAIRNIWGYSGEHATNTYYAQDTGGAIYSANNRLRINSLDGTVRELGFRTYFDASRVVPTANENRPKNINLLYCIKHD